MTDTPFLPVQAACVSHDGLPVENCDDCYVATAEASIEWYRARIAILERHTHAGDDGSDLPCADPATCLLARASIEELRNIADVMESRFEEERHWAGVWQERAQRLGWTPAMSAAERVTE